MNIGENLGLTGSLVGFKYGMEIQMETRKTRGDYVLAHVSQDGSLQG